MPAKALWLLHIPEIIAMLETFDVPVVDRAVIGGRQITLPDVESLLAAVVDPNKPVVSATLPDYLDRLLARFRQLIRDERQYSDCSSLQDAVRRIYWIR